MNMSEAWEWIKSILLAVILALIIKTFLFSSTYVMGYSMYPTLHEKDRLFTSKIEYYIGKPKRGDIIVLKAPDESHKDYIKRVIGVSNDIVELKDGKVWVNGVALDEKYVKEGFYTYPYSKTKWKVPKDHIFVLGDNRIKDASKDSRYLGCVPLSAVKGKAFFRYYPFNNRFGSL